MRMRSLTLVAALMMLPLSLKADTLYTYIGNNFNQFSSPDMGTGPNKYYSTANFVEVSFILSSPLAANLNNVFLDPLDSSFTDGTISQSSPYTGAWGAGFKVSTDAEGNIINWEMGTSTIGAATDQYSIESVNEPGLVFDQGDVLNYFNNYTGEVADDPGTWTEGPVPEPGSLILVGSGLLGAVGILRRRAQIRAKR